MIPPPRMLQNIRNQPESLARVLEHQFGDGRSALLAAARVLHDAPRIVVAGMGASFYAALPFVYYLNARGVPAHYIEAAELLHYGERLASGAAVVLVSRSGESVEIAKLLDALRETGAKMIGVTNEVNSTLARGVGTVVLVNSLPDEMVAVQSYTATVLTMLLLSAAATDGLDEVYSAAAALPGALSQTIEASYEPLSGAGPIYILGRGPTLASAHEGALLFHETAKLPAVATPAGTFRHGPVEVVAPGFSAIVFATEPATRELDARLAADLQRMGADVRTVAHDGTWPIPNVDPVFLPVIEIVPVQIAALRAAEQRGIRPGEFRYVSQITTQESGFQAYGH